MLLFPRERAEVAPGAVHLPDWLGADEQRELAEACRGWSRGPAPMRRPRLPGGGVMSVRSASLGWHWLPYRYSRTADDVDGARVPPLPDSLAELWRRGVTDALGAEAAAGRRADAALINFYDDGARMGMHRDREERSDAPVVSLSLGDACTFRFGTPEGRGRPYADLELRSGDLFVFGGPSRFAYHGVPRIHPGTAPPGGPLAAGRLNLTLRVTGLPADAG